MLSLISVLLFFIFGLKQNIFIKKLFCWLGPILTILSDKLYILYDPYFPLRPAHLMFPFLIGFAIANQNKLNLIKKIKSGIIVKAFLIFSLLEFFVFLRNPSLGSFKVLYLNELIKSINIILISYLFLQNNIKLFFRIVQVNAIIMVALLSFEIVSGFNISFIADTYRINADPSYEKKIALHFAEHQREILQGKYILFSKNIFQIGRFSGFDGSPNTSAIFLAAFGLFLLQPSLLRTIKSACLSSLNCLGLTCILVIGQTRIAIFSFICASVYILKQNKKFWGFILQVFGLALSILLYCIPSLGVYAHNFYANRLLEWPLVAKSSLQGYQSSLTLFFEHPLFGVGGDIFTNNQVYLNNNDVSLFVLQLVTGGFLLFLASVLFYYIGLREIHKAKEATSEWNIVKSLSFSSCLVLICACLTNTYLFNPIFLFFCLGACRK